MNINVQLRNLGLVSKKSPTHDHTITDHFIDRTPRQTRWTILQLKVYKHNVV